MESNTDGIGLPNSVVTNATTVTTESNVVCIRVVPERNGVPVFSEIHLTQLNIAVEGTKPAAARFVLEPTTIGAGTIADHTEWVPVAPFSYVTYDTESESMAGGTTVLAQTLSKSGTLTQDLSALSYTLQRTQQACVRVSSSASTEATVALTWLEFT